MLTGLGVKNLRGFKDGVFVKIKPITVLVGKNSSGKSSFARLFPLLRQSVERKTRGPILWYDRVDFGDFSNSLNHDSNPDKDEIIFRFKTNTKPSGKNTRRIGYGMYHELPVLDEANTKVSLHIKKAGGELSSVPSKLKIQIYNNDIELIFNEKARIDDLLINGISFSGSDNTRAESLQLGLLPLPIFYTYKKVKREGKAERTLLSRDYLKETLWYEIEKRTDARTQSKRIDKIIRHCVIGSDGKMFDYLSEHSEFPSSLKKNIKNNPVGSKSFKRLKSSIIAANLPGLIEHLDKDIVSYFENSAYMEPLRATANRYYRPQDLSVEEIDSKGENIPVYLDSLSSKEKEGFQSWVKSCMGWDIKTEREGGHLSIKIGGIEKKNKNLADVGFGYSQLLPILVQLWAVRENKKRKKRRFRTNSTLSTVVIEQPELHLHPGYQAKLADIFYEFSCLERKDAGDSVYSVIETHSPHLINRFGELVENGILKKEDIQILLFDMEENSGCKVNEVGFNDDGVLIDWPYGFFEPDLGD